MYMHVHTPEGVEEGRREDDSSNIKCQQRVSE